jgi:hypothetical protein
MTGIKTQKPKFLNLYLNIKKLKSNLLNTLLKCSVTAKIAIRAIAAFILYILLPTHIPGGIGVFETIILLPTLIALIWLGLDAIKRRQPLTKKIPVALTYNLRAKLEGVA